MGVPGADSNVIDIDAYTAQEDREYEQFLAKLDDAFPRVESEGFDFKQIVGNLEARTAKAVVLQLSLCGWRVDEIADKLEVQPWTVRRFLTTAVQEAAPLDNLELIRRVEEMKLDEMTRVCREQYKRSCEDEVTIRDHMTSDGDVVPLITRKGQSGNPAYQRVLLDIAKHRAALLGLEKPKRVEVEKQERKVVLTIKEVATREEVLEAKKAGLIP